jgi:predicted dehydrogenase
MSAEATNRGAMDYHSETLGGMNATEAPVRIGLVGAGQWAQTMHAPLHAADGPTELTGVWSPSIDRTRTLAERHGVRAFKSFADLLESSDAVDFAVPPHVQATLAREAARAGKGLMLEKPLGASLAEATQLTEEVEAAKVANIVVLTKRFHRRTRDFLESSAALGAESGILAVTGRYVHGGFLDSGFLDERGRAGWRTALGVLHDLGPHLLDLVDAAAGEIEAIRASGTLNEVVLLETRHSGGARGQLLLSGRVGTPTVLTDVDLYSHLEHLHYTTSGMDHGEIWPQVRNEFAERMRHGVPVTVDIRRALHVQRLVEAAARSLDTGRLMNLSDF